MDALQLRIARLRNGLQVAEVLRRSDTSGETPEIDAFQTRLSAELAAAERELAGRDATLSVTVGEYTVVQLADGRVKALRHGRDWRDCVGDNLVLALAQEVAGLRAQLAVWEA